MLTEGPHYWAPARPTMLAGIIAASSFLDFSGLLNARHFHTPYDWRFSVGARSSAPRAVRHSVRSQHPKRNFQRRFRRENKQLTIGRREARCFRICEITLFRLADVPTVAMCRYRRVEYRMRQRAEASLLNLIACIAALTLVVLIVMFGHPAAPLNRVSATANAVSEVQANSAVTPASASSAENSASE